jgi:TRAP-type C4-dicarboxylate transport system permease small subunit
VNARPALRAGFDALGAALVGLCGGVFAWRLAVGAMSLKEANDQTTILGLPTWIPVAAMAPCFGLLAAAGVYTAWRHWSARDGDDGALALPGSDR